MLASLLLATGTLLCLAYAYMRYVEPQILTQTRWQLRLPLPKMRIAVVSDLHAKPTKGAPFFERVVRRVNAAQPDLILLPGDLLDTPSSPLSALAPLGKLRAPLGVFAVLGNHDIGISSAKLTAPVPFQPGTDALIARLEELGIHLLQNRSLSLTKDGIAFSIAGVGDVWSRHHELDTALKGILPGQPTILLSHNPDIVADAAAKRACLIVSGHTHGGQFRLPFYGSISRVPVSIGQEYDHGVFQVGPHTTLVISRGVGEAVTQARLFAWPEIMIVDVLPHS